MKHLYVIIALLFCVSCAHKSGRVPKKSRPKSDTPAPASSQNVAVQKHEQKLDGTQIFSRYNPAVFMIYTSNGYNTYQGSGFFINSEGLALSNYHVFEGTNVGYEQIKLSDDDVVYRVSEVLVRDSEHDFILFRVDASNTPYIPLAANKPQVGERVYAIGSPKGLENTFSSGEVSQWRDTYLMQITALIDHGSSGGALINEKGQVVGITSGTLDASSQANLNYAWSIEAVKPYL